MNDTPDDPDATAADAAHELARLHGRVEAMRSVMIRLLQEVVRAEARLRGNPSPELVEANEQLLVAALLARSETEAAVDALTEAARSAQHDALTQLPNRVLLLDRLASAIASARRRGTRLALLFLDIDNFKPINDTLGHAVGDEVLKRVAHCLASSVREADTVSRYGGDEFLILLTEVSEPLDATRIADKVMAALAAVSRIGAHELRLKASIGISTYPDDGEDADTLIGRADAAMFHAKRHGLGCFACDGKVPAGHQHGSVVNACGRGEMPP